MCRQAALVFDMVFGSGWEPAVEIARIMIFSYAIVLVTGMVNQTLIALRAFRLQSTWDLGWPVCIGTAWVVVVTKGLDLYTAVSLHAVAIGGLGLVFILLCVVKLKRGTSPAVAKEV